MCFSATASFSASIVLIPAGIYCVKKAARLRQPYWVIALLPLLFGIQQVFEGFVWLGMESDSAGDIRLPALGFMFFSHLFWLFWIPFACYVLETSALKRKIFLTFIILGAMHGLLMYVPLYFHADWLVVELVRQSIDYKAILLHDDYMPRIVVRALYALIVLLPLVTSTDRYLRIFGVIIAISVATATVFFGYAFISIWCFFAAVLSLYILFIIMRIANKALV